MISTRTEFTDDYQIELRKMLEDTIAAGGGKVVHPEAPEAETEDAEVVDLVAALQRSVEAAGAKVGTSEDKPRKAPAKKAAPRKTPARKTPAKKAAAKKSSAQATKGA